jgi:hypothetical protein
MSASELIEAVERELRDIRRIPLSPTASPWYAQCGWRGTVHLRIRRRKK